MKRSTKRAPNAKHIEAALETMDHEALAEMLGVHKTNIGRWIIEDSPPLWTVKVLEAEKANGSTPFWVAIRVDDDKQAEALYTVARAMGHSHALSLT